MDGLNRAAASRAYSWVKYAPISCRRALPTSISAPTRWATSEKLRSRVPARSRYPAENRASVRARACSTSCSLRSRMRSMTARARDPPRIKVSWPGTNSRLSVREASGRIRCSVRASSPLARPGRLHCGAGARRRPCCITEIIARVDSAPWLRLRLLRLRPSQPPPRLFVEERYLGVVVTEEPRHGHLGAGQPAAVAGDRRRAHARIGQGGHLDRLLVEGRAGLPEAPASGRHDRQVAVSGLDGQQPVEHAQAVAQHPAAAEFGAGHDDRLGDGRVRVAEPRYWPRPPGVSRRFPDGRDGPVEDRARAGMVRPCLEDLGGPERRERHGVRPGEMRPSRCGRTGRWPPRGSPAVGPRAAAVPRPHRARPQQSPMPGWSCQRRS